MMRPLFVAPLALCLALVSSVLPAAAPPPNIDQLVKGLGSDEWREREDAQSKLIEIGPAALPALRAALSSPDLEVRRRAERSVRSIEYREHWRPSEITFAGKDLPVSEVFEALAKMSGNRMASYGNPKDPKAKRVTVDFAKVGYWKALKEVCDKSGKSFWFQDSADDGMAMGVPCTFPFEQVSIDESGLGHIPMGVMFGSITGRGAETRILSYRVPFNLVVDARIKVSAIIPRTVQIEGAWDNGEPIAALPQAAASNASPRPELDKLLNRAGVITENLEIRPPKGKVKKIATLKVNITVASIVKADSATLTAKSGWKSVKSGRTSISVEETKSGDDQTLSLTMAELPYMSSQVWPKIEFMDKRGRPVSGEITTWSDGAYTPLQLSWKFGKAWGKADSVRVTWLQRVSYRQYTFKFENLELPAKFW